MEIDKKIDIPKEFSLDVLREVGEILGELDKQAVPFDARNQQLTDRMQATIAATVQMWLPLFVADYKNQILENSPRSRVFARERTKSGIPLISKVIAEAIMKSFLQWFDNNEK